MRPTATYVAWSVCLCVCLLVTTASPAKTVEPIEVPFRMWTLGAQNMYQVEARIPLRKKALWSYFGLVMPKVVLRHAQTYWRSIFSTLFARGNSDAASGYLSTLAICFNIFATLLDNLLSVL